MRYQGRTAVVLGLGATGLSLVRHLVRHGANVRVADTRVAPPNADVLMSRFSGVPLETGPFSARTFAGCDLIAISPGVAKDQSSSRAPCRPRRRCSRSRAPMARPPSRH
jgi:UDP-N-acetylmuramoylalanine--D-glutamate ligase